MLPECHVTGRFALSSLGSSETSKITHYAKHGSRGSGTRADVDMGTGGGQHEEDDSGVEDGVRSAGHAWNPTPPSTLVAIGDERSDGISTRVDDNDTTANGVFSSLTLDDVLGPPPGALDPGGFEFSPDDTHIAYLHAHLPNGDGDQNWTSWMLFVMDVSNGTRHACFDPSSTQLCGESSVKNLTNAGMGVTRYEWAANAINPKRILVPQPEAAYVVDVETIYFDDFGNENATERVGKQSGASPRQRTETRVSPPRCVVRSTKTHPALDVAISPDGNWVAFVRDSEIYLALTRVSEGTSMSQQTANQVSDVDNSSHSSVPPSIRITHGASGRPFVTHGLAEFVAAEEMGRDRGLWWSPDSRKIAFTRVDSRTVSLVDVQSGNPNENPNENPDRNNPRLEKHSYPFAGEENARVTLGVVDVSHVTKTDDSSSSKIFEIFNSSNPETFTVTWLDLDCGSSARGTPNSPGDDEEYLCSVTWVTSANSANSADAPTQSNSKYPFELLTQVQNRQQTQISSILFDPNTGERSVDSPVNVETASTDSWVNISDPPVILRSSDPSGKWHKGDAVCVSERHGFNHLYLVPRKGEVGDAKTKTKNTRPVRRLTFGNWCVNSVMGIDEKNGFVYFAANEVSPLERHMYRCRLYTSGGHENLVQNDNSDTDDSSSDNNTAFELTRLTQKPGVHAVALSHDYSKFVDVFDNLKTPPEASLVLVKSMSVVLPDANNNVNNPTSEDDTPGTTKSSEHGKPLHLKQSCQNVTDVLCATTALYKQTCSAYKAPSFISLLAGDNKTTLHGAVYVPDEKTAGKPPYPLIVAVYGGPNTQTVVNSWRLTSDARAQTLREKGVMTLKLDNRGSANRGKGFENVLRTEQALGEVEVADQICGVEWLVKQGWVDPKRVAVVGWSYGGFLAVSCLLRKPEVFCAAAAGAPVTDWAKYVTHYSERYLGVLGGEQGNAQRYSVSSLVNMVEAMMREYREQNNGSTKSTENSSMSFSSTNFPRLLLAHGASDENVHLSHTKRLVGALDALDAVRLGSEKHGGMEVTDGAQDERGDTASSPNLKDKSYELLVFPKERHVLRGHNARRTLEQRISSFLQEALGFT